MPDGVDDDPYLVEGSELGLDLLESLDGSEEVGVAQIRLTIERTQWVLGFEFGRRSHAVLLIINTITQPFPGKILPSSGE